MTATLDVIDSYLSLDSTQYAQAPIGATRIATKGNGSNLYGTIPTWSATNWEIEFDVVFPTTLVASTNTVIDSPTVSNRFNLNLTATTGVIAFTAGAVLTLDGVALTSGATAHPVDGAVHKIKITNTVLSEIGVVYRSYSLSNTSSANIFNLRLTDKTTPANSRFYPMDETIATSTFVDTSANAANGTWFNRVAGDVVTVYPGAIKPGQEFWIACKYKATNVTNNSGYNFLLSVGTRAAGKSSFLIYLPESTAELIIDPYNGTTRATPSGSACKDFGSTHLTGNTVTAIVNVKANGSYDVWVDSNSPKYSFTPTTPFNRAMQIINLNGWANGGSASGTMGADIHYAYLYNSLSIDDINALMAGENPMYVGDVLQGYNLSGDGDEVNCGPALTLYGAFDGSEWYVPRTQQGLISRSLVSRNLITRSLITRSLITR